MHSAATAQSTMDFSTMAIEAGVVDSPVPREPIPERVNSPSPIWPLSIPESPRLCREVLTSTKRNLYAGYKDKSCTVAKSVGHLT